MKTSVALSIIFLSFPCFGARWSYSLFPPQVIGVGSEHVCVITDNGVKCLGDNSYGQSLPPSNLQDVTAVSAGLDFSCAIHQGRVSCWGSNEFGQTDVPRGIRNAKIIS